MGEWQPDETMTTSLGRGVQWRYHSDKHAYEYKVEGRSERFWHSYDNFMKIIGNGSEVLTERLKAYLAGKE